MKTLDEIMEIIELPAEVRKELPETERAMTGEIREQIVLLTEESQWETTWKQLKELLAPDEKGFKMLCCMLLAASFSYEKYSAQGISDEIFTDTMKCFTRFVKEYKESYGDYGFDRDFWTGRQLSLRLFGLANSSLKSMRKRAGILCRFTFRRMRY